MLEYRQVSKKYRTKPALREVSVAIAPGTVVGLVGHNGAGKSTLMKMAVGLVRPDGGQVTLDGVPVERLGNLTGLIAASFDPSTLPAHWTARTATRVTAHLSGLPQARCAEVLAQVGLENAAGKRVAKYSMGMRQRLALALAFLSSPRVLILDEPANGLDPEITRELHGWIAAHAAAGNSVLISSHNLTEVEQISHRIVVLHQGAVVRDAATRELLAGSTVRVRVNHPYVLAEELRRRGRTAEPTADGALRVSSVTAGEVGELAAYRGLVVHELVGEKNRLADVYADLTAEGASR
jgi:ABC-2 type transport system ATP-binding protein